jgi:hypothetical protein
LKNGATVILREIAMVEGPEMRGRIDHPHGWVTMKGEDGDWHVKRVIMTEEDAERAMEAVPDSVRATVSASIPHWSTLSWVGKLEVVRNFGSTADIILCIAVSQNGDDSFGIRCTALSSAQFVPDFVLSNDQTLSDLQAGLEARKRSLKVLSFFDSAGEELLRTHPLSSVGNGNLTLRANVDDILEVLTPEQGGITVCETEQQSDSSGSASLPSTALPQHVPVSQTTDSHRTRDQI